MARKKATNPTDKELDILAVLWQLGSATVRQVNDQVSKKQKVGYTTTLKLMQIMTDKGLLSRDDSGFQHIYTPAVSEEETQNKIVSKLMDKAFAGSTEKLVMRALSARKISADELKKIKQMISKMEK